MRAIAALCLLATLACRAAVRPTALPEPADAGPADAGPPDAGPPPQPGTIIATVDGTSLLALDAPSFAALPREQRLVAYWASQAAASAAHWEGVEVLRLLRGILSRPAVVPPLVLPRIREFARAVYLHRGLRDAETRRKLVPPFSFAELRIAALAAQAAGAELGLRGTKLEYFLRALEAPLFDPALEPPRSPPPAERLWRAANALDQALPFGTAPQRALLEALSTHLRSGDAESLTAAQRAWVELDGPVDFFLDHVGIVEEERSAPLFALAEKLRSAQKRVQALQLAGAGRPLAPPAFTLPGKSVLFLAALDAKALVRNEVAALADPVLAAELSRCLPQHRLTLLALREVMGRPPEALEPTLDEARADATAHLLAADPLLRELHFLDARCQELWPQFAATSWFASSAHLPQGDGVKDPRQRAIQLQLWWFTGKGALSERHDGVRRFLAADPARFQRSAAELLALLQEIAASHDMVRLRDLLESHASRLDTQWRDEVIDRLRKAGVPLRVALLAPVIAPVLADGKVIDAQAKAIDDLDAQILKDWSGF